jgi:hypothetical protein
MILNGWVGGGGARSACASRPPAGGRRRLQRELARAARDFFFDPFFRQYGYHRIGSFSLDLLGPRGMFLDLLGPRGVFLDL